MRIYFQNINGIKSYQNWHKWCDSLTEIHRNKVDIIGFAETNVNWNPIRTKRAQSLLRKQFGNGVMINTMSNDSVNSAYKPGGTSLILHGNTIGAIQSKNVNDRYLEILVYSILNGKHNTRTIA